MFRPPNQPPFFSQQQMPPQSFLNGFPQRSPLPSQMTNPTGLQGMLQRIFPSQAANVASSAGGGSNLMGTLNNVQQVLKVAQQATPLIKEYGPMIKNAPKLINMMKALNDINNEDDVEEEESMNIEEKVETSSEKQTQTNSTPQKIETKASQPKLFI